MIGYFSCLTGPIVDFIVVVERERLKVNQALESPSVILDIHFEIELTPFSARSNTVGRDHVVSHGKSSDEGPFNSLIIAYSLF